MRELVHRYQEQGLSRRGFLKGMAALGFSAAAAEAVLKPVEASELIGARPGDPDITRITGTGGELMIAQAKAAGVEYLFTNPGSFEVGFFDAFADTPGMQLIMGLHEGIVISTADGYHRIRRTPALVNVHVIAGTAQMAGQLYNASCDGSAIVVTAGLNDNEVWSDETTLGPRPGYDQKEVNRQFTKISWEARQSDSLALMLRRAFKVATTEPGGPVYLATASYALEGKAKGDILPADRFMLRGRIRADEKAIEEAARLLIEARRPLLVVGDEVWKSGAQQALLQISEQLGLAVAVGSQGFQNFPTHHPHYLGRYRAQSEYVKKGVDLIVCVGGKDFGGREIPQAPEVPSNATIVRIGVDPSSMSRNYATDLALVADVKETLEDLGAAVTSRLTKEKLTALATSRSQEVRAIASAQRAQVENEARNNFGQDPIHPHELGATLARTLDPDAIVVSENLTGKYDFIPFGFRAGEPMWLYNTGISLGWGVGASTGAKLAAPDRQVVCSIGDGSLMYSAAGFWTQARYSIPVLTLVWNNKNYQTVRRSYHRYQRKMASSGHYVGMYLGDPDIDFVKLAESQGVPGERVGKGHELEAALRRGMDATRSGSPYLVDIETARYGGGAESTWHQKFSLANKRKRKA
jgi:thiamine pyrophosphate-dependent acetolactate synthase large subunit-like protein